MKYLVVLAVIAVAGFVAADEEAEWKPIIGVANFRKIEEECIKETGATAEQVERLRVGEQIDVDVVREYIRCGFKRMGIFTDDKGFDFDRVMQQFDAMFTNTEKIRDSIKHCFDSNEQKSTPSEWAYRVHSCISESSFGKLARKNMGEGTKESSKESANE